MKNLLDRFTGELRQFIVKEDDLVEAMKMLNTALFTSDYKGGMTVNKCGDNEWFIKVELTKKQWRALLSECMVKKYKLVIKDDPDRMYFVKES